MTLRVDTLRVPCLEDHHFTMEQNALPASKFNYHDMMVCHCCHLSNVHDREHIESICDVANSIAEFQVMWKNLIEHLPIYIRRLEFCGFFNVPFHPTIGPSELSCCQSAEPSDVVSSSLSSSPSFQPFPYQPLIFPAHVQELRVSDLWMKSMTFSGFTLPERLRVLFYHHFLPFQQGEDHVIKLFSILPSCLETLMLETKTNITVPQLPIQLRHFLIDCSSYAVVRNLSSLVLPVGLVSLKIVTQCDHNLKNIGNIVLPNTLQSLHLESAFCYVRATIPIFPSGLRELFLHLPSEFLNPNAKQNIWNLPLHLEKLEFTPTHITDEIPFLDLSSLTRLKRVHMDGVVVKNITFPDQLEVIIHSFAGSSVLLNPFTRFQNYPRELKEFVLKGEFILPNAPIPSTLEVFSYDPKNSKIKPTTLLFPTSLRCLEIPVTWLNFTPIDHLSITRLRLWETKGSTEVQPFSLPPTLESLKFPAAIWCDPLSLDFNLLWKPLQHLRVLELPHCLYYHTQPDDSSTIPLDLSLLPRSLTHLVVTPAFSVDSAKILLLSNLKVLYWYNKSPLPDVHLFKSQLQHMKKVVLDWPNEKGTRAQDLASQIGRDWARVGINAQCVLSGFVSSID